MQEKPPLYILMLVSYEPTADPRVEWVTRLCAQITRTHLIGFTYGVGEKPVREYDGITYTERVNPYDYFAISQPWRFHHVVRTILRWLRIEAQVLLKLKKLKAVLLSRYSPAATTSSYQDRGESSHTKVMESPRRAMRAASGQNAFGKGVREAIRTKIREQRRDIAQVLSILQSFYLIAGTLYRRTRSVSIVPQIIICHDLYALIAGIKLKKLFSCPVLYDRHESSLEYSFKGRYWEKKLVAFIERRFIRYADVIITVSPQAAGYLEGLYGITGVVTVPNTDPFISIMKNNAYNCDQSIFNWESQYVDYKKIIQHLIGIQDK